MAADTPIVPMLLNLLYLLLAIGVWIGVLIAAILSWKEVRAHLRTGIILAIAVLVLELPSTIAGVVYLDPESLIPQGADLPAGVMRFAVLFGMILGAGINLVTNLHVVLQVGVATLAYRPHLAFPWLSRGSRPRGWVVAGAAGVGLGAVSVLALEAAGVRPGRFLEQLTTLFPDLDPSSPIYLVLVFLPFALSAAISEEVLFRGVVQGWIARWLGGGTAAVVVAILVASVVWAFGHALNTEPPLPKLVQILVLGIAFGTLSRRYGVEAAIVAHAALNIVAVAFALVDVGV